MRICGLTVLLSCALVAFPQTSTPGAPLGSLDPSASIVYEPSDTADPSVLWRKLPAAVLHDQERIWSSPFTESRKKAAIFLSFAAITAALMETDHQTSRWLPNTPLQIRVGNDVSRLGASYTVSAIAGGLYGLGLLSGNDHARETGLIGAEALIDGLITVEA